MNMIKINGIFLLLVAGAQGLEAAPLMLHEFKWTP